MKKVNFILLLLSILFITACNNDEKPEDMSSDLVMQAKSAQSNRATKQNMHYCQQMLLLKIA